MTPGPTDPAAAAPDVKVSLVVPVRNEAATIEELVDSIAGQTRPPDEVVIVDGGSLDGTAGRARAATHDDGTVRVIEAGPATPGRGRNVGIAAARHEWIALTDAGIRLDPRWLEELLAAAARNPSAGVVYGNYEPVIDSCVSLYPGMNWFEREAWDMYGVKFAGHPDLRRMFMYEEFVGHALRKDYPKEKRQPLIRREGMT